MNDVGKLEAGRMDANTKSIEKALKGEYVFTTPKQLEDIRLASRARHRCFVQPLSSLLSFPANPLAQQLLGRLAGPGRQ